MHPNKEEIAKYIWQELDEARAITIGEHMADCPQCAEMAREEARFQFLWENWQAETHGQLHWDKYVRQVLQRSYSSSASFLIKQKLKNWLEHWKGRLGSMVQFVTRAGAEALEVATRFPEELFAGNGQYQFAPAAPVRGSAAAERVVKLQTRENPEIQLYFDEEKHSLLVKVPQADCEPPLVILSPRTGLPQTACPQKVEGTDYYAASFPNVPPGGFMLLFEPLPVARH